MAEGRTFTDWQRDASQQRWLPYERRVRLFEAAAQRKATAVHAQQQAQARWEEAQPRSPEEAYGYWTAAMDQRQQLEAQKLDAMGRPETWSKENEQQLQKLIAKTEAYRTNGGVWEVDVPGGLPPEPV